MPETAAQRQSRWQQILRQLDKEYRALPGGEKDWIRGQLELIASLQQALDLLFRKSGGESVCADCAGACCAIGHNHAGLPTVLAYLQQELTPPAADFSATCPWLKGEGCVLAVEPRPYNCITFLCDKLEKRLAESEVEEFYRLEQRLRASYQAFADRYNGGGMTGLLLQFERLDGGSFLSLKSELADNHTQESG